jgi:hypothetical protein
MCALLCANPIVREWLDIALARAYRQLLQENPVCESSRAAEASHESPASQPRATANFELNEAARRRVMKRSAWLQAYCRYRSHVRQHGIRREEGGDSSRDWQKAFETIAKTWGRLLSLVGLRW